jgi:hypothetical protein
MSISTENELRTDAVADLQPERPKLSVCTTQASGHGRVVGWLVRVRATLDAGESLWTPVIMLASGYAVTIPVFLVMYGLAIAAYHLAGGH